MRIVKSFGYAFAGLGHALRREPNLRIHIAASAVVAGLALYLELARVDTALLAMCCALVIAAELFNTSIERLADRVSAESDPLIGQCKDIAAAAVLVCAAGAIVVGLLLLGPPLWKLR